MDRQITMLLESDSAQDRKKAIRLMAQMGGQEVLRTLAGLYKYDPDPDVKRLALEAGKSIKRQETAEFAALMMETPAQPAPTSKSRTTSTSTRVSPAVRAQPSDNDDIKPVFVSELREGQAADLVEKAETALDTNERDTALNLLIKAFKTNPNYRLDDHAMDLGMGLTGMKQSEFYAMLEDDALIARAVRSLRTSPAPTKEKTKNKTPGKTKDEFGDALWSTVFIDLGLCFVVLASIMMIFMIILVQTYQGAATTLIQGCPGCTNQEMLRLQTLVQDTEMAFSITPLQGGLLGVIWACIFVFQLLVYYGVLHVAVHYYLSPEGTFRGMLHYCVRFDMGLYCIVLGLGGAIILMILRDVYSPHFYTLYENGAVPLWTHLIKVLGIATLVGGLWSFRRIIVYYNEGCFQVGCVMTTAYSVASTLLSGIAAGILDPFITSLTKLVLG